MALATLGRARTHYRVSPDPQVKGHGPSSSLVSAGYRRTSMLAELLAQASVGEMKCVQASGWEDRQKVRAEVLVACGDQDVVKTLQANQDEAHSMRVTCIQCLSHTTTLSCHSTTVNLRPREGRWRVLSFACCLFL